MTSGAAADLSPAHPHRAASPQGIDRVAWLHSMIDKTGNDAAGYRAGCSRDAMNASFRTSMIDRCSDYGSIATKCKAFVRAVHQSVWRLCCRQASREPLACAMKRPDVFARRAAARGRASLRTVNPGRAVDRWRMSQDTRHIDGWHVDRTRLSSASRCRTGVQATGMRASSTRV